MVKSKCALKYNQRLPLSDRTNFGLFQKGGDMAGHKNRNKTIQKKIETKCENINRKNLCHDLKELKVVLDCNISSESQNKLPLGNKITDVFQNQKDNSQKKNNETILKSLIVRTPKKQRIIAKNDTKKHIASGGTDEVQLTKLLKVVIERNLECSPDFLGFSSKEKDEAIINSPKSEMLTESKISQRLKVILERLGPISSPPEFLGFTEKDKRTEITPRSLKVVLSRLQEDNPIDLSSEMDSTKESHIYLHKKNLDGKILQINLQKISNLEKRLLTQIDGVYHLSETDLDDNLGHDIQNLITDISPDFKGFDRTNSVASTFSRRLFDHSAEINNDHLTIVGGCHQERVMKKTRKKEKTDKDLNINQNLIPDSNSPDFKGFEREKSLPPTLEGLFENSLEEMGQYFTMVAEESFQGQILKNGLEKEKSVWCLANSNLSQSTKNIKKLYKVNSKIVKNNVHTNIGGQERQANNNLKFTLDDRSEQVNVAVTCDKKSNKKKSKPNYISNVNKTEKNNMKTGKNNQKPELLETEYSQPALRRLPKKNYLEESELDISRLKEPIVPQKKVPIYKQTISEKESFKEQQDEYEFTDLSPKKNIVRKNRIKRSSGFFDKNTHQIIKQIEKKEQVKKRPTRKKKKNNLEDKEKRQSYENTVKNILANVLQKINKKDKLPQSKNVPQPSNNDLITNNKVTVEAIVHTDPKLPATIKPTIQKEMRKIVPEINHDIIINESLANSANKIVVEDQQEQILCDKKANKCTNVTEVFSNLNQLRLNNSPLFKGPKIQTPEVNNKDSSQNFSLYEESVIQNDVESCFGFIEEDTPDNPKINLIANVVVNRRVQEALVDSPVNFNTRRPNANSTMIGNHLISNGRLSGSPFRLDLKHVRQNPHFVSIKSNALPRIDQEMVLDHTLVEEFESKCTKTPQIEETRRSPIQQSILNYIECDDSILEKENIHNHRSSLFDYEAFNSPIKKVTKINERVQTVRRKILGESSDDNITKNIPEVAENSDPENNITYFGFDENSPEIITKQKSKKSAKITDDDRPSRFDPKLLRKYQKSKKKVSIEVNPVEDLPSVSIFSGTDTDKPADDMQPNDAEIRLFAEPEELFDSQPVEIPVKKTKRRRAESVDDPDETDAERKHKRLKKTKFELEQEEWIQNFNKELEEVESFNFDTE